MRPCAQGPIRPLRPFDPLRLLLGVVATTLAGSDL